MAIFKREDNKYYNMSQQFIDGMLINCPFCGTKDPHWLVAHQLRFLTNESLFSCEKCSAIIRINDADISGEACNKYTARGFFKLMERKKLKVIYVKIDDIGNVCKKYDLINTEIDIKILYDIVNNNKTI